MFPACPPLFFDIIGGPGGKENILGVTFTFVWNGPDGNILHENGHSLSIGHFGKLFKTDANGKSHFAPRTVMNAGYTGPQHEIIGPDNTSFCSIWASWPNN